MEKPEKPVKPAEIRSSCLDPETLAAWTDGGLTRDEVASVEAHAASCARCQAMLAAMAKTAPPLEARTSSWRRFLMPALVPLTAVIVLAIWLAVPDRSEKFAQVTPSATAPSATAPSAAGDRELFDTKVPASPPATAVEERRARTPARQMFAKPEIPAEHADAAKQRENTARTAELAAPAAAAAPAAEASNQKRAEPLKESIAVARDQAASQPVGGGAALDVIAQNRANGWRVSNGQLERSTDGGETWTTAYTNPVASLTADSLTAVSSPEPNVCWAVGRGGIVLVTSDGKTWRRMRVPKTVDLVSVVATDANNAFVTGANGSIYVTSDAGKTWEERRP